MLVNLTPPIIYSFWVIAIVFSLFYGFYARQIFVEDSGFNKPPSWKIHQFWFNFLGASTGWILLWCVIPKIFFLFTAKESVDFTISDGLLVLLSFIGITGHLPMTIWGVITSANGLIEKLFKK